MKVNAGNVKDHWCPMAQVSKQVATGNRVQTDDGDWMVAKGAVCIGPQCMAWRWARERNPDWKPVSMSMVAQAQHPDDVSDPWRPSTTYGYCGLAGAP